MVQTPGGPLTVATTHLSFVPGWNTGQLRRLVSTLEDLPRAQLVLGDLNMTRVPRALRHEWTALVHERTWPAQQPHMQLDHVLARGAVPAVVAARAELMPLSDHRALVVDFADRNL